MHGLMMDRPLQISSLLEYAADNHGETEMVSWTADQPVHRARPGNRSRCQRTGGHRRDGRPGLRCWTESRRRGFLGDRSGHHAGGGRRRGAGR